MLQKKVCMVGAFATGKTSLVSRFVKGIYSEKYQTTIGVKIDKKQVQTHQQTLTLMIWDIHGEDEFQNVRMSYLRGAAAYLLVVDGTRRNSLTVALQLRDKVAKAVGNLPFIIAINKRDLHAQWEVSEDDVNHLKSDRCSVVYTSAKDNQGVENCFLKIADKIMEASA
ncbi:MAG: Rab family GTPase [Cyanobacteria bacterium P01_D01_bin.105]